MHVADLSPVAFEVLDVGGVVVAAILGGMVARERHFDLVGFMALAIMAALGGGMLRDVLLQQGPPVALTNPHYLRGALAGATIAFLLRLRGKWWNRLLVVADAFVLGSWSATGAVKTLEAGLGIAPAVMLGVITAVGGGMIRDIAVGRTPLYSAGTLFTPPARSSLQFPRSFYGRRGTRRWPRLPQLLLAACCVSPRAGSNGGCRRITITPLRRHMHALKQQRRIMRGHENVLPHIHGAGGAGSGVCAGVRRRLRTQLLLTTGRKNADSLRMMSRQS
ncbi:TRIC cation channel family protein [Actinobaculum sp. 313]|uniref:trimeric intracellular cation channel family protein n=1 Tax=Actinobaculum sp. 313 TaxID=2495645 RepID=UPI001F0C558D|nr:TRIC cation channel family protein [Actinobaculum sp. 313]